MPDIIVTLFLLGLVAGLVQSDLRIPRGAYDVLGILLMFAIGLKGGVALSGKMSWVLVPELIAVAMLGVAIPLVCFPVLHKLVRLDRANSASIAAHYGSVSAGTFAVVLAFAESRGLDVSPQTTLYLVLLELPAIVVAILLVRTGTGAGIKGILHEALTSRGVLLLVGGVVVGMLYSAEGVAPIAPLYLELFHGLLALFLLEMGLLAARALGAWRREYWRLAVFALLAPPLLALSGMLVARIFALPPGSALVLTTLVASASYIAAPAAIRQAIPEADIGMAMIASLGITFPFNVLLGIPLYQYVLSALS